MKKVAVWGLVGGLVAGSLLAVPAEAQLKTIKDAANKLAAKVTGTEAPAADTSATVPSAPSDKSARVTVLDKQTNRRQTLVLIANEPQTLGTLQVKLSKCLSDYEATLGQDVAWLDITENSDGSRSAPWFSGWMFNTYPEVSTLDHPRYDVQVQGCGVKARQIVRSSGAAPVLDSTAPADTESGGGDADPYFVPGVGQPSATVLPTAPSAPAAEEPAAPVDEEAPAPAADTEAPAAPAAQVVAPVEPVGAAQPAAEQPANGDQQDLHRMMDNGTY